MVRTLTDCCFVFCVCVCVLEVKLVLSRMNRSGTGKLTEEEWTTFLSETLRFMNDSAFDKHCSELRLALKQAVEDEASGVNRRRSRQGSSSGTSTPASTGSPSPAAPSAGKKVTKTSSKSKVKKKASSKKVRKAKS